LIREIIRRGHSIENHSCGHSNFYGFLAWTALRKDIVAAQEIIAGITGRPPVFFVHRWNTQSAARPVIAQLGLRYITWTRRGFDTVAGDPAVVLDRPHPEIVAGDILLLHDRRARNRRAIVLDVLPALLDRIAAAGLKPVSLPAGDALMHSATDALIDARIQALPGGRTLRLLFLRAASSGTIRYFFRCCAWDASPIAPGCWISVAVRPSSPRCCWRHKCNSSSAAGLPVGLRRRRNCNCTASNRTQVGAAGSDCARQSRGHPHCGLARCAAAGSDVVVLIDVLHYLTADAQVALLKRIAQSLRGGGLLVLRVADISAGWRFYLGKAADRMGSLLTAKGMQAHHHRPIDEWCICSAAWDFQQVSIRMPQSGHSPTRWYGRNRRLRPRLENDPPTPHNGS